VQSVTYYTASDVTRLILHGQLTPAGIRAAVQRGDLQPAATTAGGIKLYTREQIEDYVARRDARRDARRHAGGAA
jgi:DNA-binding transcriptional MerR regulator